MHVNPLAAALPATPAVAANVQSLRVSAGEVTQIQTGVVVAATVIRSASGEAVLDVSGKPITVRSNLALSPGDALNVRVHAGANPSVEIVPQPRAELPRPDTTVRTTHTPPEHADVVEVLAREPNGQYRVRIDGRETLATSEQLLTPGGRFVLKVETTTTGTKLTAPQETSQLPATVATAILRATPVPQIGEAVRPLLNELQGVLTLAEQPARAQRPSPVLVAGSPSATPATPPDVQKAVGQVRDVLESMLPQPGQPPTAETLRTAVQNGGQQFEAKITRSLESIGSKPEAVRATALSEAVPKPPDAPAEAKLRQEFHSPQDRAQPNALSRTPLPPVDTVKAGPSTSDHLTDLKGGLLSLLRAIPEVTAAPVAASVLDGIERQQAVNVLAQQTGGPLVFQIPFPDGPHWRTLNLGVEPDRTGPQDAAGRPTGFRVMMHVPLSELGETWIDAGADGSRLRAVLYVSDATARERVRTELGTLRPEVLSAGYNDVWLDVRAAADLTEQQRRRANAIRGVAPEAGGLLDVSA